MPDKQDFVDDLRRQLDDGLAQMDLALADEACETLIDYVLLLAKWNKTHNLTAVTEPHEMVRRHLLDSLSIATYADGETLLDVGAGAGLPGIPLAIVKPHMNVTLVDSVQKKTLFMGFAANTLGLANVQVVHSRVENLSADKPYQTVVARAFASLEKLCLLSAHLLATQGKILAMVGHAPSAPQLAGLFDSSGFSALAVEKLWVPGETAARNIVVLQRTEK